MTDSSSGEDDGDLQARPVPGQGVVGRYGNVFLAADPKAEQADALERLLGECRTAGASEGSDGRALIRHLAGWLATADPDVVPSFAVAHWSSSGLTVLLHGAAELTTTSAGTTTELSAKQSAAWVDRIIPAPIERLVISSGQDVSTGPHAEPWLDLRTGVVPGTALVVQFRQLMADAKEAPSQQPAPVEETAPPPTAQAEPAPTFESVLLMEPEPPPMTPAETSVRPVSVPQAAESAEQAPMLVQGVNCKRGHFNDPNAAFCGVCGISMVQQTHQLVEGPRPTLGVLVSDNGETFAIDRDYVIGREPEADPLVRDGAAQTLELLDDEGTISRSHAWLRLNGWDVELCDRSSNGTYIATAGSTDWVQLPREVPVRIAPGTRIRIGSRTLVFDSHVKI